MTTYYDYQVTIDHVTFHLEVSLDEWRITKIESEIIDLSELQENAQMFQELHFEAYGLQMEIAQGMEEMAADEEHERRKDRRHGRD